MHTFGDQQACNRFDDKKTKNLSEERQSMERYLHYFDRYNNHARSLKLEAELEAKVPEKVESLQVCGH